MAPPKLLIVEDDPDIVKLLRYNLEKEHFSIRSCRLGEEALRVAKEELPDLIILDLMLPGVDGLEVCRTLKKTPLLASIPVLMLTARGEEVDRIVGLELGADDYVTKPFSVRELILRVKTILKRKTSSAEPSAIVAKGEIVMDTERHEVTVGKKQLTLTSLEFKLLRIFLERAGKVQSRETLLNEIWEYESDVETRTVDTHVKRLRAKMGKAGALLETVRGIGYRLKE